MAHGFGRSCRDEAVEAISHPRTMATLCLPCPGRGEAKWFEGTHRGHGDCKWGSLEVLEQGVGVDSAGSVWSDEGDEGIIRCVKVNKRKEGSLL